MALQFKGLEAVEFRDIVEVPQIDNELKLRLQTCDKSNEDEVMDLLASAFPKNKTKIRKFIEDEMSTYERVQLLAYLVGGSAGLELYEKSISDKFNKIAGDDE